MSSRFNRVHAVCAAKRGHCSMCPAWERDVLPGVKTQRSCYGQANEIVSIGKFGNPWGLKATRKHVAEWRKRFNK